MEKEANILWDDKKGPFANLFHFVEMGVMVFASPPMMILTFLSSLFGVGLEELGSYIDESLGLNKLEDVENMDHEAAAKSFTSDLFGVTEDVLSREASLYSEAGEFEIPLSLTKSAAGIATLRRLLRLKLRSGGGPGFIGYFYKRILGVFRWAFKWLKRILVGGVGILALEGSDYFKEEGDKSVEKHLPSVEKEDSTKKYVKHYRNKLEKRVEDIISR